jgi:hypothetical protein
MADGMDDCDTVLGQQIRCRVESMKGGVADQGGRLGR